MRELITILPLVAVVAAVVWLLRRLPRPRCPFCGSAEWIVLGETKQCSQCRRLF